MFEYGRFLSSMPSTDAWKQLNPGGGWDIYFNPVQKLSGIRWNHLEGYIDEEDAQLIVELINTHNRQKRLHAAVEKACTELSQMTDEEFEAASEIAQARLRT